MVRPETLSNPERSLALVDRQMEPDPEPVETELEAMRRRLIEAGRLEPTPQPYDHCRHCWYKGRDAAVLMIRGGG